MAAPVHRAAKSDFGMNFGLPSLAEPQAAASSVARYSQTDRRVAAIAAQSTSSDPCRGTLLVRAGFDQAGIGSEAVATDKSFSDAAAPHTRLKCLARQIALTKTAIH